MLPKLNRRRARFVLTRSTRFLPGKSRRKSNAIPGSSNFFDDFLERRFPESRRKAYYLMSIHEHLPPQARKELKEVGWAKGLELAKIARRDRQHFDCATWLHKAREMPKEEFKQEAEKELTGRETEPWEIVYFKVYKSQIPIIEQAIEMAALDAGHRQIPGLLPGDDLCGLSGWNESGE